LHGGTEKKEKLMVRLVINDDDFAEKLTGFVLKCGECGSNQVTLDIDWAAYPSATWLEVYVICEKCKHCEEIFNVSC